MLLDIFVVAIWLFCGSIHLVDIINHHGSFISWLFLAAALVIEPIYIYRICKNIRKKKKTYHLAPPVPYGDLFISPLV